VGLVAQVIAPSEATLVVVDVQNDFCADDGAFGRAGHDLTAIQSAVERIAAMVDTARGAAVPIVWVRTEHDRWTDSPSWLARAVRGGGTICAPGSWGAEFYRVKPTADERIVTKHRYSAFVGSSLEVVLRALGRPVLLFCGITTNVCVESTLRDAFVRDWHCVLLEDCAGAPTKMEHDAAVHNVRTYFGRTATSVAIASAWGEAARR